MNERNVAMQISCMIYEGEDGRICEGEQPESVLLFFQVRPMRGDLVEYRTRTYVVQSVKHFPAHSAGAVTTAVVLIGS
jgi:hypothetical protein